MKKIKYNFGVMLGPYIKYRGTRGTEMSYKLLCRPRHSGDICTRGNNLKNYFGLFGVGGALMGYSMMRLRLSCFPAILSPISSTCEIRKQSDEKY